MFIADAHCDTLYKLMKGEEPLIDVSNFGERKLQIFSIFDHWKKCDSKQSIKNQYSLYKDIDFSGKYLSIEGLDVLNDNKDFLDYILSMDIKYVMATWNNENCIAGGAKSKAGLSAYGKQVIKEIERANKKIDLSHLNEKSFYDIASIIKHPPMASHSCCYSLCNHARNLKDEQIKLIIERKGIIGVCFYPHFLDNDYKSVDTTIIAKHIDHICQIAGNGKHVCFGSDFDGMEIYPKDVKDTDEINNISKALLSMSYKKEDIFQIFYGNLKDFVIK